MYRFLLATILTLIISGCMPAQESDQSESDKAEAVHVSALYEIEVQEGVSHEDVVDSLKSLSEGMNFVNPANFDIGENMAKRDIDPQGVKEVYSYCNLSLGTEIILDHPEFLVFAPCRIALYEKPDANNQMKLYLGLDRPTIDLKSIKNPTPRAQKAAQELEDALIDLMQKASEGDF